MRPKPFTPSLSRGAPILLLLIFVSCKHVEQVDQASWTPPPPRKEEPAQQTDASCPARALLVKGQCRAKEDCLYTCVRDVERKRYGDCACPAGQVCIQTWGGAYPGTRQGCVPGCGSGGTRCLPDERCVENGRCEGTLCGKDYVCPAGMSCTPGEHGADVHGCSGAPCGSDTDCPCPSYCVMGQCQGSAGRCESPRG